MNTCPICKQPTETTIKNITINGQNYPHICHLCLTTISYHKQTKNNTWTHTPHGHPTPITELTSQGWTKKQAQTSQKAITNLTQTYNKLIINLSQYN